MSELDPLAKAIVSYRDELDRLRAERDAAYSVIRELAEERIDDVEVMVVFGCDGRQYSFVGSQMAAIRAAFTVSPQ